MFNLILSTSALLEDTVSLGRLLQWDIAYGNNKFVSWFVEMNFYVTSYCSSCLSSYIIPLIHTLQVHGDGTIILQKRVRVMV